MDNEQKQYVLGKLAQSYKDFSELLDRIDEEQAVEPNVVGIWSVNDTLAHIVAHLHRVHEEIIAAAHGKPYPINYDCNDDFNAGAVAIGKYLSFRQLRTLLSWTHQQVVALVQALPDEAYQDNSEFVRTLGDTVDGAVANNSYAHYAEHMPAIIKWLDGQPSSR